MPRLTRRPGLVVAVGCGVLAVASGIAAPPAGAAATAQPARAERLAQAARSPKQLAAAEAASMLVAFRSPPSARRSGPIAVAALSAAPAGSGSPDFVSRTGWWQAPGTIDAVLAWVKAHPPAGFTLGGSGASSDPSGITSRFYQFDLPPLPGVLQSRSLYVSAARDGAGGTALRVDSLVTWLPAKSPAERIPAAARIVTITAMPAVGGTPVRPIRAFYRPVTVDNRTTVTKIAKVIDGLPLMPPGVFSCPFDNGQGLRLTFRATERGPVLATVTAETNGCGTVTMKIGGKEMPALWGGARMSQQVLKLAGIHWKGF